MSIVTDSTPLEAPKDPNGSAIFPLYSLFATEAESAEMRAAFEKGGTGYGEFKKQLFGKLWDYFAPMRKRRAEIVAHPDFVEDVLKRGAERANSVADEIMQRVRSATGISK